jgi:dihydroorotase
MNTNPPHFNLLLKGGRVIDPATGRDGLYDVGISEKKIAAVAPDIPPETAAQVVDVTGLIVTPGIIDMHTHVYTYPPTPTSYVESMHADAHLFASGVTTTVDAGTAGWRNFSDFKTSCIDRAQVRILAYLNIAGDGMVDKECEQDIGDMHPKIAAAVAEAYSSLIVGIKTAHYWTGRTRPGHRSSGRWKRASCARCR